MTTFDRKINQIVVRIGAARPVQIGGDLPGGGRHRTAHGKRPGKIAPRKTGNKKEVNAARAVSTSFFASFFRGGHSSGVSSGAGGWNPSRAILSRVAFTIYPATLSPAWAAAVFKSSSISFGILIDFVANFDK